MFAFLKQIFAKEEPLETEEVKIDDLLGWLDDKLSQIDFKEDMVEFFNKIKDNAESIYYNGRGGRNI